VRRRIYGSLCLIAIMNGESRLFFGDSFVVRGLTSLNGLESGGKIKPGCSGV